MTTKHGMWLVTASGLEFDLYEPKAALVCLDDIAHALSMICRFGGHVSTFYSVAEHSLLVGKLVHDATKGDQRAVLYALLHDAAEAYVGDVIRPIKRVVEGFDVIESLVMNAILEHFNLPHPDADLLAIIKRADLVALVTERQAFTTNTPTPWMKDREGIKPCGITLVGMDPATARLAFRATVKGLLRAVKP